MRDFTYIVDIADGTVKVLDRIPQGNPEFDHKNPDPASSHAPYPTASTTSATTPRYS